MLEWTLYHYEEMLVCSTLQQKVEFFRHKIVYRKLKMQNANMKAIFKWKPHTKMPEL